MRRPSFASLIVTITLLLTLDTGIVFPQAAGKRVALVIGNSTYSTGPLRNAGNDAGDMAKVLRGIGFSVALGTDANKKAMYQLIDQFGTDIRGAEIALFYYSGHGVQAGGENYLIPIGADISMASDVEIEGVQLQRLIGRMNAGGATTNVIVLDACRNNPFPQASKGMERGLAVIGQKPPESVIVYATEAGETADDGSGRNGVFTAALLRHITRNDEFTAIIRDVNAEVRKETNQKQKPAKYDNLTRGVYLAGSPPPSQGPSGPTTTTTAVQDFLGSLVVRTKTAGTLYIDGKASGDLRAGGARRLSGLDVGWYELEMRYASGDSERLSTQVDEGKEKEVGFSWTPPLVTTTSTTTTTTTTTITTTTTTINPVAKGLVEMVLVQGGSFRMGSDWGDSDQKPTHRVTVSPFMIGKYEVAVGEFRRFVNETGYRTEAETGDGAFVWTSSKGEQRKDTNWNNPGFSQSETHPVSCVSWNDALAFCNWLSDREGLQRVYRVQGAITTSDFGKNGYRLPTEAEWEYAARGGPSSRGYNNSGSNDVGPVAWYSSNSGSATHPVGTKAPNELGLYDMSGNVWEWCWDWYDNYGSGSQTDPVGASSGGYRVSRGGSWYDSAGYLQSAYRNL